MLVAFHDNVAVDQSGNGVHGWPGGWAFLQALHRYSPELHA
jgi:hypothetical protein